jgi:hypothetical protein
LFEIEENSNLPKHRNNLAQDLSMFGWDWFEGWVGWEKDWFGVLG